MLLNINFNSIKVRLNPEETGLTDEELANFNSIKVRLNLKR